MQIDIPSNTSHENGPLLPHKNSYAPLSHERRKNAYAPLVKQGALTRQPRCSGSSATALRLGGKDSLSRQGRYYASTKEYGIIDAAAFLLERVGDVGGGLSLTLSDLNDKFVELDAAVEAVILNHRRIGSSRMEVFNTVLRTKEASDIHNLLRACIGLCQRNTPRLNPEEPEAHWFKLLDSFSDTV